MAPGHHLAQDAPHRRPATVGPWLSPAAEPLVSSPAPPPFDAVACLQTPQVVEWQAPEINFASGLSANTNFLTFLPWRASHEHLTSGNTRQRRADRPPGGRRAGRAGGVQQPPGTWSDDGSLALCTAESLLEGYDLQRVADSFVRWLYEAHWTPHGRVFDVGGTTHRAIERLRQGVAPTEAGGRGEWDNGNGSLMRILPLALRWPALPVADLLTRAHELSCLTHAHPRAQLACGFYTVLATRLLAGAAPAAAYEQAIQLTASLYKQPPFAAELPHFQRVFAGAIEQLPEEEIRGSGYVVHTLEASLWCLLRTNGYSEAVLKAVNLGEDTDTTGAVTGGLAGIAYGLEGIPQSWVEALARLEDVRALCRQLVERVVGKQVDK